MNTFVDTHRDAFGVEPICRVLQIAPSGYRLHATRQRNPALRCARAQRDDVLIPKIERVWQANLQVYGIGEESDGYRDMGQKSPQQGPCDFQLVSVADAGHEAQTDGKGDCFTGSGTHGQRQTHPILGEDMTGAIALMTVVEADGRTRGFGRVSQDQGIVDDEIDHDLGQCLQEPAYLGYGQCLRVQGLALQQFVIGSPVAAQRNIAEDAGNPAFRRDQATAEKFEEAAPRAGWHDIQKAGNPLRETEGNETMKGHG